MQSLIVIARNPQKSFTRSLEICQEAGIDKLDITVLKKENARLDSARQAIGIEEVRDLQKSLILKPFKSTTKGIIVQNAETLTLQAQNAMLKTLEEPPNHTLIILTASSKELLLSTIVSRCKIIELEKNESLSEDKITEYLNLLISLLSGGVGERLKIAQEQTKTQADAIVFLEKMIIATRQKLLDQVTSGEKNHSISQSLNFLISFQRFYKIIKTTNANPRFTLETLLLNF